VNVDSLSKALQRRFVVFDGPDGAGKSTQRKLLADALESQGAATVSCRDPGGTVIGDRIRSVLLDHDLSEMDVQCETLLFMASRAQLVGEIIRPALAAGKTVLCDRFVSSTCAYQGAAGFDPRKVLKLADFAIGDCWPHVTIVLDMDADSGLERVGRKPHHSGKNRKKASGTGTLFVDGLPDAMEARPLEFHRKVRQLFLELPTYYPSPVEIIDARGDVQVVHQRVAECLTRVFS